MTNFLKLGWGVRGDLGNAQRRMRACVCVCVFCWAGGCSLMHNLSPLVFFRVNMLVLIFAPSVNLRHLIFFFGSIDELNPNDGVITMSDKTYYEL